MDHPLVERWRADAAFLRNCGATEAATTREDCAAQLEVFESQRALEQLTIAEAAKESGYSIDHLQLLVRQGTIPNAGKDGAPRVARKDLPKKPGSGITGPKLANGDPDLLGSVRKAQGR